MIATIAGIVAFALLFALFGALQPRNRGGCGGGCEGCGGDSCPLSDPSEPHV